MKLYSIHDKFLINDLDYQSICESCGVNSKEEQLSLRSALNTCGTCISFQDSKLSILNPIWISDFLYTLHELREVEGGILDYPKFVKLIENKDEYKEYAQDLLEVLSERGLCRIRERHDNRILKKEIFCPILLPESRHMQWQKPKDDPTLTYIFQAQIPPDFELQSRMVSRWEELCNAGFKVWQYGVWLARESDDSIVIVELIGNELIINIWADSVNICSYWINLIKTDLLERSNSNFFKQFIHIDDKDNSSKALIPYDTLKSIYSLGLKNYYLPDMNNQGNLVNINILLLGEKCGLDTNTFGEAAEFNAEYINKIREGVIYMDISVKGDFIKDGIKSVVSGGSPTIINTVQNNAEVEKMMENLNEVANQIKDNNELQSELLNIIDELKDTKFHIDKNKVSIREKIEKWADNVANVTTIAVNTSVVIGWVNRLLELI